MHSISTTYSVNCNGYTNDLFCPNFFKGLLYVKFLNLTRAFHLYLTCSTLTFTYKYIMLFLTFANVWSMSFFFLISYLLLITSLISYLLPIFQSFTKYTVSKTKTYFSFINSFDFFWILVTPLLLLVLLNNFWVGPVLSVWFGHLLFTAFQVKITYLILATFLFYFVVFTSTSYFTSREIYDFTIVTFHFLYWITFLFYANTIFTVIFIIEVLGALIFLLVITSTFSSTFFYRNLNLNYGHLFQQSTPHTYLQSILYIFWISLISSLNLFLFLLLFYFKILTLDWYLVEYIFIYFINTNTTKDIITLSLIWFVLLFSIFVKCGLAPVFIWKPTFFKGLPLYTLFFYITFFYSSFYVFVIHFILASLSEVFYFYIIFFWTLILLGLFFLLFIICETYYIKAFLAISSILNSLLVFLALASPHYLDILLVL